MAGCSRLVLRWADLYLQLMHVFIVFSFNNCELIYCSKVCKLPGFLYRHFNFRLSSMFLPVNLRSTKGKVSRTTGSETAFILVSQWVTHRVVINKLTFIAVGDAPSPPEFGADSSRECSRHTFIMSIGKHSRKSCYNKHTYYWQLYCKSISLRNRFLTKL